MAGLAYHSMVRPRMNRWGATEAESRRPPPGDELVAEPWLECTREITIERAEDVVRV